jgi:outer membrane immunogenic protein
MKRLLLAAGGLVAISSVGAIAADLPLKSPPPPVPVFTWTGLYIGGNVGWHWGSDSITTTSNPVGFPPPTNIDTLSPVNLKPQGAMGGFQMGYNWQMNYFVFGIEGDANWLGGGASRHLVYPGPSPVAGSFMDNSTSGRFLGTIRPRAGFSVDRLLLYVTGGVAFGSVKTTDSFCINNGGTACVPGAGGFTSVTSASGVATKTGWTAGAGAEWAITNDWSVKAEYLYVDLGSFDTSNIGPGNNQCGGGFPNFGFNNCSIVTHHKYTDNIARVGVNYHFGSGY